MKKRIAVLFLCFAFVSGMAQASFIPAVVVGCHVAHHAIIPGFVHLGSYSSGTAISVFVVRAAFAACVIAAVWHIPAWEKAKASHSENAYQAQEMWPQQLFDKLPGGTPGRLNAIRLPQVGDNGAQMTGNAGNFEGGMSN